MLMVLFDLLMTAYQGTLLAYAIKKQTAQRPHAIWYEAAAVTAYVLFYVIIQSYQLPVPEALSLVIFLAYAKLASYESLSRCALWAVLNTFLSLGALTLVSGMFDMQIAINGNLIAASEDTRIIYYFVGNAAVTVVMNVAARLNRTKQEIALKETLLFVVMLVLLFVINECFFTARLSSSEDRSLLVGALCTFLAMIVMMVLYDRMVKLMRRQRQAELAAQTAQLVGAHQEELKSIYQNMLSVQHDLRHRVAAVEEILSSGDISAPQYREALQLLETTGQPRLLFTGCIAVDAILKAKQALMDSMGISFDLVEYPLTRLPIPQKEFCMLLGNLLDNAVEGVMRLPAGAPSRQVCLSFTKVWDVLFITCANDADTASIRRSGEEFVSSKEHPELHGFGIKSMKKIVEDAGGSIAFHVQRDKFTVEIMLGSTSTDE